MTKYKCGHKSKGFIIIEDSIVVFSSYLTWADSVGVFGTREVCWECWCKNRFGSSKSIGDGK